MKTAHLWRTKAEMNEYCVFAFTNKFLLVLLLAKIFTLNYEAKGIAEGVRFGAYIGVLMALLQFGSYAYMPLPITLALFWVVGAVISGLGLGVIFSLIYKNK